MSLTQRFEDLRKVATLLEKKEPVPPELWAAAGVKVNCRLKDVQTEITSLKKKVSAMKKEETKGDEDEEEEDESKKAKREGRQDVRVKEDRRRVGLDKKNLHAAVAAGAYDMDREYAD